MIKGKQLGLAGRILLGVALAFGSGSCTGDAEVNKCIAGDALGTGIMMSPNSTQRDIMGGAIIRQVSQDSLDSYNAEKSRSQVNIYVGGGAEKYEDWIMLSDGHNARCHYLGKRCDGKIVVESPGGTSTLSEESVKGIIDN